MADQSELEGKYFLDGQRYNCPFCKIRSVLYHVESITSFDESEEVETYIYKIKCLNTYCNKTSVHYSHKYWGLNYSGPFGYAPNDWDDEVNGEYDPTQVDRYFFHHTPTSYFSVDMRIPPKLRKLVSEAQDCREIDAMVGASGALRKAIYEFLKLEKAEGDTYEDKIKDLKKKHPKVDEELFNALDGIQGMTSMQLHEQDGSFKPWTHGDFDYFMQILKDTFHGVYVAPKLANTMHSKISQLLEKTSFGKKNKMVEVE